MQEFEVLKIENLFPGEQTLNNKFALLNKFLCRRENSYLKISRSFHNEFNQFI